MGRTVPSFRIALYFEQKKWKKFRSALNKKDKKSFDELFDITRLHISACMMMCNPICLQPIMMTMIFHHYKQIQSIIEGKN